MAKEVNISNITFWYTITFCATIFFLNGYFPLKTSGTHSLEDPPSFVEGNKIDAITTFKPSIDRLVIIIIDGLRYDFVNHEKMPLLMSEIKKHNGCVLETVAEAPTVTMPRIKAITTGSVPQFIDIALNLDSRKLKEDSFLHRFKELNKNIVFYGDNTWLSLFPDMFLRSEGTSSFYASDFIEVDKNVTRNIPNELKKKDWNLMILHYLGLDHIGHVHGPLSPFIRLKLKEMDQIIENISSNLSMFNNTAVIVTTDHGMRDGGSHGGTTHPEIHLPFAWIGPCPRKNLKFSRPEKQIDIAVTISALMGTPIPADNAGKVMSQLFDEKNIENLLYIYYYNSLNLIKKDSKKYKNIFDDCFKLHKYWVEGSKLNKETMECYEEKLGLVSDSLVNDTSSQILPFLIISSIILFWSLLALAIPSKQNIYLISVFITTIVFLIENFMFKTKINILLGTILLVISLVNALPDLEKIIFSGLNANLVEQIFGIGNVIGTLALISSSFVEEEHQIWLFFLGTFILYNVVKNGGEKTVFNFRWIISFIVLRFLRNLNRIGDQNWNVPDISDWLYKTENYGYLITIFFIGLFGTYSCAIIHSKGSKTSTAILFIALTNIFIYKAVNENTIWVEMFWACLVLYTILESKSIKKILPCIWMAITALFMRPWNVILIPGFYISSHNIFKYSNSLFTTVMAHIWLARVFSNGQGNDNSIGSVDISPGYIGFSDYYPLFAGLQIFCHRFAFPILGNILLLTNFKMNKERLNVFRIMTVCKTFEILYVCIVSIIFRHHLFVWSVFSPKLLVEASNVLLLFLTLITYFVINSS